MVCKQNRIAVTAALDCFFCHLGSSEGMVGSTGNLVGVGICENIMNSLNRHAEACKSGAECGVRVNYGVTVGLVLVEYGVQIPFAGRLAVAVDNMGFEIHDNNVFWLGLVIGDSGGLDGHKAQLGVINALVAAGAGA